MVEEGAQSASFFVLLAGSAAVTRSGALCGTLRPADWFGEVGLLKNRPRSATVKACERLAAAECDEAGFERLQQLAGAAAKAAFDAAILCQLAPLLRKVPQFESLDLEALSALADVLAFKEIEPGEALCLQNERSDGLFVVLAGRVNLELEAVAPPPPETRSRAETSRARSASRARSVSAPQRRSSAARRSSLTGGVGSLEDGAVRLLAPAAVATLGPSELGGFASLLFAGAAEPFTARAVGRCVVLRADAKDAEDLVGRLPQLRAELERARDDVLRSTARDGVVATAVRAAEAARWQERVDELERRLGGDARG